MELDTNSYVIARIGGKKTLVQITEVGHSSISGIAETKDRHVNPLTVHCAQKDILVNLGPNPEHGSVYGVSVEPYWRHVTHDDWGKILLYTHVKKAEWVEISKGLSQAWRTLKASNLHQFAERGNVSLEIRPSKGKNAGMYYYRQKGEQATDRIMLRIQEQNHHLLYKEVMLHEAGHGVFYRMLSLKQRAEWIKMHTSFANFVEHDKKAIEQLGFRFSKSRLLIEDFEAIIEDDAEALLFGECIANICSTYRIKRQDINDLIEAQEFRTVREMWPKVPLDYTDFENSINEYASKNHKELMAEAFRIYHTKTELPKVVKELMEKHLAIAAK